MSASPEITETKFGVRYASDRRPHPTKTEWFGSLVEAQAAFARFRAADKVGDLKLIAPDHEVLEAYPTRGGTVIALVKEAIGEKPYWRIDLWKNGPGGFYSETLYLHPAKKIAAQQIMPVYSGVVAAERAEAAVAVRRAA